MEHTITSKILIKNDTTNNWTNNNPILSKGEIGIEIATDGSTYVKIGDGLTAWNSLKYQKNILTDDTTGTNYTLGVDNGLLYILSLD